MSTTDALRAPKMPKKKKTSVYAIDPISIWIPRLSLIGFGFRLLLSSALTRMFVALPNPSTMNINRNAAKTTKPSCRNILFSRVLVIVFLKFYHITQL